MLYEFSQILKLAEEGNFCLPAFNVYNMETVQGVIHAAEKKRAPVIIQCYSRLFDSDNGMYVGALVMEAAKRATVPVCFHLDHGAGMKEVLRAIRYGATGVMLDVSTLPLEENIAQTKQVVSYCADLGFGVEGELGHIGSASDAAMSAYADPAEAERFAKETGVSALAIMVGTAHGYYKQAPVLDIPRIAQIKQRTGLPLVLHGGSGVPDDQLKAAIAAGIRKINFGTDICYAFLNGIDEADRKKHALDLFLKGSTDKVAAYCEKQIDLLGAANRV